MEGFSLNPLLWLFGIVVVIAIGISVSITYKVTGSEIRSYDVIKPEIVLEINDNKVDTVYVYKIP